MPNGCGVARVALPLYLALPLYMYAAASACGAHGPGSQASWFGLLDSLRRLVDGRSRTGGGRGGGSAGRALGNSHAHRAVAGKHPGRDRGEPGVGVTGVLCDLLVEAVRLMMARCWVLPMIME